MGVTYSRPLLRPRWCSKTSNAPSKGPPTRPPLARNSAMVDAFQSFGSGMSGSCRLCCFACCFFVEDAQRRVRRFDNADRGQCYQAADRRDRGTNQERDAIPVQGRIESQRASGRTRSVVSDRALQPIARHRGRHRDKDSKPERPADLLRTIEERGRDPQVGRRDAGGGAERERDEGEAQANSKEERRSEDVARIRALEINSGKPEQTQGTKKRPEGREHSRADLLEELRHEFRCHRDPE